LHQVVLEFGERRFGREGSGLDLLETGLVARDQLVIGDT
jgi:hypothetical protein